MIYHVRIHCIQKRSDLYKMAPESAEKTAQYVGFFFFTKIKGLTWKIWQSFAEYIKKEKSKSLIYRLSQKSLHFSNLLLDGLFFL